MASWRVLRGALAECPWEYREHPKNVIPIGFYLGEGCPAGCKGRRHTNHANLGCCSLQLALPPLHGKVCAGFKLHLKKDVSLISPEHSIGFSWHGLAYADSNLPGRFLFSHPAGSSLAIIFFLKVSAWGNKGKNAIGDAKSESRRGRNAQSIYFKIIKLGTGCVVTYQGPLQL